MRLALLVAMYQAFGVHILQKLEYAGIADGPVRAEAFMNLAHRCRAAIPQDAENFDFGWSGFAGWFFRYAATINDFYRRVNEKDRTSGKGQFAPALSFGFS